MLSAGTGDYVVADDERERYEFTWVGKRQAMIDAATPIRKTLRPCPEESKNWETTENLYIEGDNLEVLKLLQESYLGKVKMIYIDPPYNTGKDFIYKDNFTQSREEYEEELDMFDEEGKRLFQNTETNGRFHSDWCSMIYPRLQLARNLLTDDGVIFISIDDNEVRNLKNICDEVFGEDNFIAQIARKRRDSQANLSKNISPVHEYILIYSKQNGDILNKVAANINESAYKNPDNDPRGPYVTMPCTNKGGAVYDVTTPTGQIITEEWRFKKETYDKLLSDNKLVFPRGGDGKPRYKLFLSEKRELGVLANTWWDHTASNQEASKEIKDLFDSLTFDTPKPVGLLNYCLQLATSKNSIILDFFSGSATTAHAVMQLNAEDGGNRKYIMIQLPEVCDPNSEAAKAGYKTICEIGKERIRRAGAKIEEQATKKQIGIDVGQTSIGWAVVDGNNKIDSIGAKIKTDEADNSLNIKIENKPLDTGFRVFKLDTTNMKDVYYAAGQLSQKDLWDTVSNIKDDRTDIDLLYGCLLDWGVQLSMPHTTETIDGFTIHAVDSPLTDEIDLVACFDNEVSEAVVRTIATRKPLRAVFRDSSFADSANKINVFEIFKSISPDTSVKVI